MDQPSNNLHKHITISSIQITLMIMFRCDVWVLYLGITSLNVVQGSFWKFYQFCISYCMNCCCAWLSGQSLYLKIRYTEAGRKTPIHPYPNMTRNMNGDVLFFFFCHKPEVFSISLAIISRLKYINPRSFLVKYF